MKKKAIILVSFVFIATYVFSQAYNTLWSEGEEIKYVQITVSMDWSASGVGISKTFTSEPTGLQIENRDVALVGSFDVQTGDI